MKIIKPSVEIMSPLDADYILKHLEMCGRVCYKSEDKIGEGSAEAILANILKRGHEAVIEHFSITVKFICDRGISHEIVRHRLASYCQESTRYCNYSKEGFGGEITVIEPCYLKRGTDVWKIWEHSCRVAEAAYFDMLSWGCTAQEARAVLPHSLKTEVVMTADIREWRHFLRLRAAPAAHPQMRELTLPLHEKLQERIPLLFDGIR